MKIQHKNIAKLKRKLWPIFSKWRRMKHCLDTTGCKDWGLCITCGKRYHIKLLQCGHFVSGRHNGNLFSVKGTAAQCYNCNINLKGNTLEYRRQIIKLYGEGVDLELEQEAAQVKKFTVEELEGLIERYAEEIKGMEKGWC
jgi:hypothetical protein